MAKFDYGTLASWGSNALNIMLLMMVLLLVVGIILGAFWFWNRSKRYSKFECLIFRKDAIGKEDYDWDVGGIFVDGKTKNKRLFLKKHNVSLNADNIPYINKGKKRLVMLHQDGLKNFAFINPVINARGITWSVGEEDINWALQDYERQKKKWDFSMLLQYMPYIMIGFTTIVIVVILISFFKEFKTLGTIAEAMREASHELAQAKAGTVILD